MAYSSNAWSFRHGTGSRTLASSFPRLNLLKFLAMRLFVTLNYEGGDRDRRRPLREIPNEALSRATLFAFRDERGGYWRVCLIIKITPDRILLQPLDDPRIQFRKNKNPSWVVVVE